MKVTLASKANPQYKLSEREVKEQVKDYLDLRHIFHYPIAAGPFSKRGLPDRAMHIGGQVIYLEMKTVKGKLSPEQQAFKAQCEADGIDYWVIRDIEELHAHLEGISG